MNKKIKDIEKQLEQIASLYDSVRSLEMLVLNDIRELGINTDSDNQFNDAWGYLGGDCYIGALMDYINKFTKGKNK